MNHTLGSILFFLILFIYPGILFIFRQRGREGLREGEKHQHVVASRMPPTRDLALNPGMCPDWESKQWHFSSQAGTQSIEPHQPGHFQFCVWVLLFSIRIFRFIHVISVLVCRPFVLLTSISLYGYTLFVKTSAVRHLFYVSGHYQQSYNEHSYVSLFSGHWFPFLLGN